MSKTKLKRFGWKPDLPDKRDMKYQMPMHLKAENLPRSIDLRPSMPAVYDQGDLGSCTGQAIAADVHFQLIKQGVAKPWQPSAMFIYYNERVIASTVNEDSGAELRDGMKSLNRWGVCEEQHCPYIIPNFRKKPTRTAYRLAVKHRVFDYRRIPQTLLHLKSVLAQNDPFVFGYTVYESFDSMGSNGMMTMPDVSKEQLLGGHAVLAVGYNDDLNMFIVRNSWGTGWGDKGYFYMPYSFIADDDYAADFWTVRSIPN